MHRGACHDVAGRESWLAVAYSWRMDKDPDSWPGSMQVTSPSQTCAPEAQTFVILPYWWWISCMAWSLRPSSP